MQFGRLLIAASAVMIGIGFGSSPSHAVNLVLNGDFSGGYASFSSDYGFPVGGPIFGNGQFTIVPAGDINASTTNIYGDWTATNHDPSGGNSNVLVADGATTAGQRVWFALINLVPHTNYVFGFDGIDVNFTDASDAVLGINLDGTQLASLATSTTGWQTLSASFNSGALTSALFSIVDTNTASGFNDFAIDNLSLSVVAPTPIPPTALLFLSALGGLGFVAWRRRVAQT